MFLAKKLLGKLILPLGIVLLLLLASMFVRGWRGRLAVALATLLLLVASLPIVGFGVLDRLERDWAPLDSDAARAMAPGYIVVLSAGQREDAPGSAAARLDDGSLRRTLEGVRIAQAVPGAMLVLSGGSSGTAPPVAEAMAAFARELGMPAERMVLETGSRDTHDQAVRLAPLLGDAPFVLVTSASHMRRSMGLFRAAGAAPIAAPTEFIGGRGDGTSWSDWLPDVSALDATSRWAYEQAGLLWTRMRGQRD